MALNRTGRIALATLLCLGLLGLFKVFQSDRIDSSRIWTDAGGISQQRGIPIVAESTEPSKFLLPKTFRDAGIGVKKSVSEESPTKSEPANEKEQASAPTPSSGEAVPEGKCDVGANVQTFCKCLRKKGKDAQAGMELFTVYQAHVDESFFKIYVYNTNDIVSTSIKDLGSWELATSRMFVKAMNEHYERLKAEDPGIQKKDVKFLDIGANIGWFSILIASMGFGVISVEPMLSNLQGFKHSVCDNKFQDLVTIHETALAEEPTTCKLFSITNNVGDGTIACGGDWTSSQPGNPKYVFRQNVTFSRLDDLIPDTKNIGLVKMDVEGYEGHVVGGGQKTLLHGSIPKIMSEWSPWLMHDAKSDPVEFLELFRDAGYAVRTGTFDTGQIVSTRAEFDHLKNTTDIGVVYIEKL